MCLTFSPLPQKENTGSESKDRNRKDRKSRVEETLWGWM